MKTIMVDISSKDDLLIDVQKNAVSFACGSTKQPFCLSLYENKTPWNVPAGTEFSVWYSGPGGEGCYSHVDGVSAFSVSGHEVTVAPAPEMTAVSGSGLMCLMAHLPDGSQKKMWNLVYTAEGIPGGDTPAAAKYFAAFSGLIAQALQCVEQQTPDTSLTIPGRSADAASTGAAIHAAVEHKLDGAQSAEHPGCFYRMVNGVMEWINPPAAIGVEYRTVQRWNGHPVYQKIVALGRLPNAQVSRYNNIASFDHITELSLLVKTSADNDAADINGAFSAISLYGSGTASIWAEAKANIAVNTYSWDASGFEGYALMKYVK